MSGSCSPEPSVTNSKAASLTDSNETVTAYFECLSGFTMSGSSRIYCNKTLDVWDTAPTCSAINSNVYVYNTIEAANDDNDWWYYYLAAFLTLLFLLLTALVVWCCCWAPRSENECCCGCIRHRGRRLEDHHYHRNHSGIRRDNIFWIDSPQKKWPSHTLGHHYLYSDSQNGSLTSLGPHNRQHHQQQQQQQQHNRTTREVGVEASLDSTSLGQSKTLAKVSTSQMKNSTLMNTNYRHVLTEVDTADKSSTSGRMSLREAPVTKATRPAKDPTKDTKIWMPHSHSIRDNNTSTK